MDDHHTPYWGEVKEKVGSTAADASACHGFDALRPQRSLIDEAVHLVLADAWLWAISVSETSHAKKSPPWSAGLIHPHGRGEEEETIQAYQCNAARRIGQSPKSV
jgi:hypothetical protein